MNAEGRIEYQTRDDIMNLLSPDELATVSAAEEEQLPEGDEYIDLEHPENGVQNASADTDFANALPHTAVSDETWGRILDVLETPIGEA